MEDGKADTFAQGAASGEEPGLQAGTRFGPYVIVRKLGSGGMGAVYEATHTGLDKRVALKTLHRAVSTDAEAVARFVREGRVASRIRHPNVVDVSDVGTQDGVPYLVMEYFEGEDLGHLLERDAPLSALRTADIMLPVLAAVAAAHDEAVVHRDLKPENIFLARTKDKHIQPKVLDFGISKIADPTGKGLALTSTATLLGTPYYMSPEQARGSKHVDARADQYSLGVILYECATGQRPFQAESLFELVHLIVAGEFASPRTINPNADERLERVILRALHRDRDHRFPNVRALGAELLPMASPGIRTQWEAAFASARSSARPSVPTKFSGTPVTEQTREAPTVSVKPERQAHDGLGATLAATEIPRANGAAAAPESARPVRVTWLVVGAVLASVTALTGVFALRHPAGTAPSRAVVQPQVSDAAVTVTSGTSVVGTVLPTTTLHDAHDVGGPTVLPDAAAVAASGPPVEGTAPRGARVGSRGARSTSTHGPPAGTSATHGTHATTTHTATQPATGSAYQVE